MANQTIKIASRLSNSNISRGAHWIADRFLGASKKVSWHIARLRTQAHYSSNPASKLPPGSIGAFCLSDINDHRFYLKRLKRYGPIFKVFWGSGQLKICLVGFPRSRRLLAQHRSALEPVTKDLTQLMPKGHLRGMSPEYHPIYRRLFRSALQDGLIDSWEPELRRIIRLELAGLAESSPSDAPPAEQLHGVLDRACTKTLLAVVFGVRPDADIAPALEALYQRLGPRGFVESVGSEQEAAYLEIRALVLQILESVKDGDEAEFADSVLSGLSQLGPESIIDETVIGNAIYLVERGRHDLRDLWRWVLKYLSDNPSVIEELVANPADSEQTPNLAKACVSETLRLDQAEVLNRNVTEAFEFDGYHIPESCVISILLRESHRDADTFPEPDKFRPHRFLEQAFSADEYAPFGIGEHRCIASSLVVKLSTMFVEELVNGFTWSVINDGPRQYGHVHWQPSPSFSIEIRSIDK